MNDIFYWKSKDNIYLKYIKREQEYNMRSNHFHNFYEIYYLVKGERKYTIENSSYHAISGTIVLIDLNQLHKTTHMNDTYHERILIQFPKAVAQEFFKDTEFNFPYFMSKNYGSLQLNAEEQLLVGQLLFNMIKETTVQLTGYEQMIQIHLKELLIFLQRKINNHKLLHTRNISKASNKKMLEIMEYISENYININFIDELAEYFYLDKSYMSRKFKQVTGYTIKEYIDICRIKQAQLLLETEQHNISSITKMVGYNNMTSFENNFKKYLGVTPLKYRKKLKNPPA